MPPAFYMKHPALQKAKSRQTFLFPACLGEAQDPVV